MIEDRSGTNQSYEKSDPSMLLKILNYDMLPKNTLLATLENHLVY